MKRLLRPRLWIALMLGLAAGVRAWRMPLRAEWTARLPHPEWLGYGPPPFSVMAVSSNGRFLITHGSHEEENLEGSKIYVWDRERGDDRPAWQIQGSSRILLSPDETQLAVSGVVPVDVGVAAPALCLFDLASGQEVKQWRVTWDHLLFSPDGKLLAVIDRVLRELETDRELRRLPADIDGFRFSHSHGEYAVYEKESLVRVYSWHSGKVLATHDLVGNRMVIHRLSQDGRVVIASGTPPGSAPWSGHFSIYLDGATGTRKISQYLGGKVTVEFDGDLSPDGRYWYGFGETRRASWLPSWWPGPELTSFVSITHRNTDRKVAHFTDVWEVQFSPQSNRIALNRRDFVVEVHSIPTRTPWGRIVGVVFVVGVAAWGLGGVRSCKIGRFCLRKTSG